jgi:hypothetical protein
VGTTPLATAGRHYELVSREGGGSGSILSISSGSEVGRGGFEEVGQQAWQNMGTGVGKMELAEGKYLLHCVEFLGKMKHFN